ncbi:protein GVQW3-like [Uloborus diversus]|uniref:protein GVQW3-like n=1 Tax=Uloborus diversus TaxID=327109 RepID=UPI00240A2006|nr:protein GVQW3-like [Uloborus diversus]
MGRTIEQRVNIKFYVKLKKTPTKTLQMINKVYGEEALSRTLVFQFHKNFREDCDNVHDEQRAGRPSTSHTDSNVQKVRDVLNTDRRLSIRAIAKEVGIDMMTVHDIVPERSGHEKDLCKAGAKTPDG